MTTFTGIPVVSINGVTVTVANTPPIQDIIGQRGQVTLTIVDQAGALAIRDGHSVLITDGAGAGVWSGFVVKAVQQRIAYAPPTWGWQLTCVDASSLADRHIAASTYANQTCGFIVNDLIKGWLAQDGVYAVRNMLSANQSDVETDTTGFAVAGAGTVTLTRDTTQQWHGAASLKCVCDGTAANQGFAARLNSTAYVAGQTITQSVYLRGSGTVRLFCQQLSPSAVIGTAQTITLTTTWTRYSVTVTLPNPLVATEYGIRVDTTTAQSVTFWADGLMIEPGAGAGTPVTNLLSAQQSDIEGADLSSPNFKANLGASGGISQDTSTAWHGTASLKCVVNPSGTFQSASINLLVSSYVGGQTYTFSAYMKASTGTPTIRFYCQANDLITGNTSIGSAGSVTLSTTWTRYTFTVTMPADLSPYSIIGIRADTGSTSQAITWWMDALQIEAGAALSPWTLGGTTTFTPGASTWELGGTSTVQAGPTLTAYPINYESVSKHLDALAQLAGFYWNIDANRRLIFAAYNTTPAPFTFDGTQADDPDGNTLMTLEHSSPMYRNGQYVLGITEVTSTQTETRKGDGNTTAFPMSYPLHAVPTITLNGGAQTVGISGVDSGKQWYWSKGTNTISQDSGGTKLISTDTLQVVYKGEYKTLVYSQDDDQIALQQSIEGNSTSGIVQQATTDTSITTTAQGFQSASALLAKYATAGKTLSFKTLTGGLQSGMLLTVTLPEAPWNISGEQFLIESVVATFDGFQWWYDVQAMEGPVNDTWVNFFKRLAAGQGVIDTSSAGVSQTVTLLQTVSETWTWTESVTETVYACPVFPATFPLTLC